eukprot:TRINITY_DN1205_c0_g1_i2.p1 TRINITY_DN1205_c0_g1~~TRINITY_DN1205_c0_g1_i2.p1  ORF type:complete len:354 (+),score=74.41 TRINITY_DN1205_c0_g1_i2:276-1337(+)
MGDTSVREEDNLPLFFKSTQSLYHSIDNSSLDSRDPQLIADIRKCLDDFKKIHDIAQKTGVVVSRGEELDDVTTESLRYVLVPYYIAELELKIQTNRVEQLRAAKLSYLHFLSKVEQIKLLHKEDVKAMKRDNPPDAQTKRSEKINRAMREKDAKNNFESALLRQGFSNVSFGISVDVDTRNWEEELLRQYLIYLIGSAGRNAISQLEQSAEEEVFARMHAEQERIREERGGRPEPRQASASSGLGRGGGNNYVVLPGGVVKPIDRLTRTEIKKQVFQPSHILPTYTPEEAVEAEIRNGGMVKGKGGKESEKKDEDSDNSDNDDDNAVYRKKRDWDDWKDDHPRGGGNTMGRG